MKKQRLHNVGNTNGKDVFCLKCDEPFENLYVLEDFTDAEYQKYVLMGPQLDDPCGDDFTRIEALNGCPSCKQ